MPEKTITALGYKLIWGGLFFALLAIPWSNDRYYYYYCFVVLFFCGIVAALHYGKHGEKRKKRDLDWYPLAFVGLWVFGFFNGIIRGSSLSNALSNNIGTFCLLLYFVLSGRKPVSKLFVCKSIMRTSVCATLLVAVAALLYAAGFTPFWPLNNIYYNRWTMTLYDALMVFAFVVESVSLWRVFCWKRTIGQVVYNLLLFALSTYVLMFTGDSGGYHFGYLAVLAITIITVAAENASKGLRRLEIVYLLFVVLVLLSLASLMGGGELYDIFTLEDGGNAKRWQQFDIIADRFAVLGNGLGSLFTSYVGSAANSDMYGVEISYLNIVDKYGLLSLVMMYVYVASIGRCVLSWRIAPLYRFTSMGLLGFLFVAIGNPVLFAPVNTMLLAFAWYLLSQEKNSSALLSQE